MTDTLLLYERLLMTRLSSPLHVGWIARSYNRSRSVITGERTINRPFILHGVRNSRASEPNVLERVVAHRAHPVNCRLLDAPSPAGHPPALHAGHHTTHQ